ncbi:ABC transporter ATP-binding protein [Pararhodobacter sp. CCB-MM2]|uniref:ABC transporter ATP-binding protein n=1 Tax=Pararhodobacter sp. CCB-MM2 TaxID=1786003 RepID=UPI000833950C|nr:ABC transporter ATP-binding protein [Pararhodobacter sp. CCB-MM2]
MLEVQALHSGYGRIPILNGVSLTLGQSEILGVLGHNGAGKTTLMRAIAGFLPATQGRIAMEGRDLTAAAPFQRANAGLGYVPQGRQIFPALSVRENLTVAAARSGRSVDEILALFPRVARLLDRPGGALSGGEQQLLALARCLCTGPSVMLLDEPTEGIQPSIIDEIIETLQTINREQGVSILLVEQNLECLAALSKRILLLDRGTIVESIEGQAVHDEARLASLMMKA